MCPHPSVCHHPAYPMLLEYMTTGCPVDCSKSWTIDMLTAAINHGNHASAQAPDAVHCLREEAMEKVHQGYMHIVKWEDIAQDSLPNLKISLLVAVPHKSHIYCTILDLSFQLHVGKLELTSVNGATTPHSLHHSMDQMEKVLPCMVYQVAHTNPDLGPLYFAKWDIKDSFGAWWCHWKMCGIFDMYSQSSTKMTPPKSSSQCAFKWDGVNHPLFCTA